MADQQNKAHRKGKEKKQHDPNTANPKAFAFAHPGRYAKQYARSHDIKEKRLHVPLVDRLPEEAPPLIVGVVGPPQVGKTTLIKSLLRRYTKQTISDPKGPLTVVTSKRRRLTFIESPSDSLAGMIDLAKVVDIVLLMIDGKYGFEMETMEFLNVLNSSGMPGNVFGILTKLDLFKKQDTLRAQKKRLKHRFWSELYQGAKLFYLSGVINGRYPDREVLNLSRFLSVMKNPRPLVWRNSHPYCLADRMLDITPPTEVEQDPKCDRTVALYGYLRGTNFPAQGARVHVPGIGDLNVANVEALPDPCPTPYLDQAIAKATGKSNRKRLGDKQKILFAPMSDVGGVLVDSDAVYIDVKTSTFDPKDTNAGERGLGEQLVMGLQGGRELLGQARQEMKLFRDSDRSSAGLVNGAGTDELGTSDEDEAYVSGEAGGPEDSEDELETGMTNVDGETISHGDGSARNANETLAFADSDSDIGSISSGVAEFLDENSDDEESELDDNNGALNWKENLSAKAKATHGSKVHSRTSDLARLMYDLSLTSEEALKKWKGDGINAPLADDAEDNDNDFFRKRSKADDAEGHEDRMTPKYNYESLEQKWVNEDNLAELKQKRFSSKSSKTIVGDNESEDDEFDDEDDEDGLDSNNDGDSDGNSSDEGDGAFEDLETGETHSGFSAEDQAAKLQSEREKNAKKKEELKLRFEEEDKEGFLNDKTKNKHANAGQAEQDFAEDEWYDAQKARIQKQLDINRAEFEEMDENSRRRVEGYKPGTYVRLVLDRVPCEFSQGFNPRMPIIIGGLQPTEDRFGFVQVRIKRHRWYKKILKTNDPLIFSLGWRRFQTIPIYSISDSRTRNRMLKYTPEHMHCFGSFYGPLIAPNTGFCCVQSFSSKAPGFRLAATGVVLSVDESTEIVKKLKLTGTPAKIYKNTAIIKDMFGSDLEIMKFKSGNLRTVSGVRGMIKGRAGNKFPQGYVRAGFEDKILMSDIVFLSTWRVIKPREFYTPVTNLLMPNRTVSEEEEAESSENIWHGMRLTGEVRREQDIPTPQNRDSQYRPIERPNRHFNPLRVPRKLQADLPFKSQITQMKPQKNATYLQQRAVVLGGEERRARDLMQKLATIRNEKVAKRQAAQEQRKEPFRQKMAENLEKKAAREKREKAEYWKREGKKRKHQDGVSGGVAKKRK